MGRGSRSAWAAMAALALGCILLAVSPASADMRLLSLPTKDLIYDSFRQRIYASVPATGGARANTVTTINPETGEIGPSIPLGQDPGRLALSDDGHYLYVGLDGVEAVRRVDLQTGKPDLQFSVRIGQDNHYQAEEIEVFPGRPHSVAVSIHEPGISPSARGVVIYDDGIPRPSSLKPLVNPSAPLIGRIEFSSATGRLYGHSTELGSGLYRINLTDAGFAGVDPITLNPSVNLGYDMEYADGRLYFDSGAIVDPEQRSLVGVFPGVPGLSFVLPDPSAHRVFFLSTDRVYGAGEPQLLAYDMETRQRVFATLLPVTLQDARSFILWGRDGLAFRTDRDQVVLLRTRLRTPDAQLADLVVTGSVSANPVLVGDDLTFEITVRNYGPDTETGAVLRSVLPQWTSFVSLTTSQGRCTRTADQLTCELGELPSGAQAVVRLVVQPTRVDVGSLRHTATVRGQLPDPDPGNNVATQRTEPAMLYPCPPTGPQRPGGCPPVLGMALKQISLPTRDLVYDRVRRRIYASVPARAGAMGNGIVELDPSTGAVSSTIPIGSEPGRLAISDDGQYLYVALDALGAIQRIDLASHTPGLQFPVGPGADGQRLYARDMEVLPGDGGALAVLRGGSPAAGAAAGVAIYDNGVPRGRIAGNGFPNFPLTVLEPSPSAARLYAYNGESSEFGFRRFTVDDLGVSSLDVIEYVIRGYNVEFKSDQGLVFATTGRVIDPETGLLIGTVTGLGDGALVAPDLASGRIAYLTGAGETRLLRVHSSQTFRPLATLGISNVNGRAGSLIRSGEDMLAFRTDGDQVFLLRLVLFTPIDLTLSLSPSSTIGGAGATGTVTLGFPAPDGGATVLLSSENPALATVPPSVWVPAGQTRATFPITTRAVGFTTDVNLKATYLGSERSTLLHLLTGKPPLAAFTLSAGAMIGGTTVTGTVTLAEPAPAGGRGIGLSSGNPAVVSLPSQVVVPAAARAAAFVISTRPVTEPTLVPIWAAAGTVQTARLWVLPVGLSLTPASVQGGKYATGTFALPAPAPTGGAVVTLASTDTTVAVPPARITIPAGARVATFPVRTFPVSVSTRVILSATFSGVTWTRALTVSP